jgi:hypothetical protein
MKQQEHFLLFRKTFLIGCLFLISLMGWGQNTAIYSVSTTNSVTASGVSPSGSSSSYTQTFGTVKQMTSGNSASLTLSGYAGYKITNVVLEMRSNSSSGAGTLSMVAGSTSISSVNPSANFNSSSWNGSWSSTYVNVTKVPTLYSILNGENVVITISATANSLYIQKFSITYEPASSSITYDGNGSTSGSAPTDASSPYNSGSTVTVLGNSGSLAKTGYSFNGWNTAANGSGTTYSAGNTFAISSNTILYAQWLTNSPTFNAGTLANFPATCTNTSSNTINSFTLSGINLTSDVTISSLNGFSYALTSGGTYTSSLTLIPTSNSVSEIIYVKFSPTAVQSYNGNIEISGGGASSINVSAVAEAVNTIPTITTPTSASITLNSANLGGNTTSIGCTNIIERGIYYSTTSGFANGAGTKVSSLGTYSTGTFTVSVSGLASSTTYYYKAFATNDGGTSYTSEGTFTTSAISAPVAIAATNNDDTSFTANWNTVSGATSYQFDVSEYPNFGTLEALLTEGFESTTFPPSGWLNTNWTKSTTLGDFNSGNAGAICATFTGSLTTLAVSNPYSLSFYLGRSSNTTIKTLTIEVSTTSQTSGFVTVATYNHSNVPGSSYAQYTVDLSAYKNQANVYIKFSKSSSTTSPWRLDDILINKLNDNFLSGYQNLTVNSTSQSVTGLSPDTNYYYRVRAVNGTSSVNSNSISTNTINNIDNADFRSVTSGDFSTTSTWQYNAGTISGWLSASQIPTTSNNITIQSSNTVTLNADLNVLASKELTINSGATLIIASTKSLEVAGDVTNNGTIIFKSDANGSARLGQVMGNVSGTGVAKVERYIAQGKRAYRFLAPGVTTTNFIKYNWQEATHITGSTTGANGFDQTASGGSSMFTYNNQVATGTGWTAIANTNDTNLEAEKGYRLLIRGDRTPSLITAATADNMNTAITLSATGTLKTGTVTINATSTPVATNNTTNGTTNGFSLVGNPYVSPIDWHNVTKTNLNDTYYIWDTNVGTSAQRGRYVSYSQATGINNYGNTGVSTADRYLQAGQAFFVKNTTLGTASSLVFNESNKAATSPFVLRTNNQNTSLSVLLYAPSDLAIGGYPMDGITSVFGTNFDAQIGYGDVLKLESSGENLAWFTQTKKLDINAQAPVVDTDVLLIKSLRLGSNKSYTFRIKATNFDTSLTGYLVDNYLNTQQVIDFTQDYFANFSTTTEAQSFGEDRFKIVFSTALNNNQFTKDTFVVYPNPVVNNQFTIKLPVTLSGNVKVKVHNLLGQEVFQVNTTAAPTLEIAPKNILSSGVYIVSVMGEGISSQQKITVQ